MESRKNFVLVSIVVLLCWIVGLVFIVGETISLYNTFNFAEDNGSNVFDDAGAELESGVVYEMPKELLFTGDWGGVDLHFTVTPVGANIHEFLPVVSRTNSNDWKFYKDDTSAQDSINLSWNNSTKIMHIAGGNPFDNQLFLSVVLADKKDSNISSGVFSGSVCRVRYQSKSDLLFFRAGENIFWNVKDGSVGKNTYDFHIQNNFNIAWAMEDYIVDYEITAGIGKDVFVSSFVAFAASSEFIEYMAANGFSRPQGGIVLSDKRHLTGLQIYSIFFGDPNNATLIAKAQQVIDTFDVNTTMAYIDIRVNTANYPSGRMYKLPIRFGTIYKV